MGSGLTQEQKRKIESNIQRLDYLKGTGVITSSRKHLAKELFVFISVGGVGHQALASLKTTMAKQVNAVDIEKQVMFLAVDTAIHELNTCIDHEEFSQDEVLKIPYEGAHDSIDPSKILPQLKAWVHEELWGTTGAEAVNSDAFNGSGAGAIRQCGRVLLSQSGAQNEIHTKLSKIPRIAAKMGDAPKIQVFFLAGISGGTGSGTLLDLAFLTRHFLKSILGAAYSRATFSAYLFLPSACRDSADLKQDQVVAGNRNAYAALKEVDYYMTLTERQEHFVMNYGTANASNVDIADNVFDFCTLVEGNGDNGHFFEGNAATARQIVADCIMNIICTDNAQTVKGGNPIFLVDSFLSNRSAQSRTRIESRSDKVWPRDANYIYNVIGYSACIVPIDLMTVYVFKKIFDESYKRFRRAEEANSEEVCIEFLDACGLSFKEVSKKYKTYTLRQMLDDIDAQTKVEFKASGPFYVCNLLKNSVDLIKDAPEDYLHKAYQKKNAMFANIEKWSLIEKIYKQAADYLIKANQDFYEIYKYVVITLKELLEHNAKLLTDTNEYENQFGRSFSWSPIDMTPGDQATTAVTEYLDEMFDQKAVNGLAKAFMQDLCDKKEEWTGLKAKEGKGTSAFDAANAIRSFIAEYLQKCVDTTLEEFLVKAYSGRKDAPVYDIDSSNRKVCSAETKTAANEILRHLSDKATALASTVGFKLEECYKNNYMTLPDNCTWLHKAMVGLAPDYGLNPNDIYESSAKDSVGFCRLYAGVPAWALFWTSNAEEAYEGNDGKGPRTIGLHMDQGRNGTNWEELPNLYPEKLWSPAQTATRNREASISKKIRSHMECAKELGLLTPNIMDNTYYDLALINKESNAEDLLKLAELDPKQAYGLPEVVAVLIEKGAFKSFKVQFSNMVMTTPEDMLPEENKQFLFELACRIMRRRKAEYKLLEITLPVAEELKALLEKRVVVEPEAMTLFMESIKWGLLVYDGRRNLWKSQLEAEKILSNSLNTKLEKQCAHYYGFQAFGALSVEDRQEFKERIDTIKSEASDEEFDRAGHEIEELKASLKLLKDAKKPTVKPWKEDSPFKSANESPWPMGTLDFEEEVGENNAEMIRRFYTELINNM